MMKVVDGWRAKYLKFLMQYKVDFPELSNIDVEIFRWERKWTFYEVDIFKIKLMLFHDLTLV